MDDIPNGTSKLEIEIDRQIKIHDEQEEVTEDNLSKKSVDVSQENLLHADHTRASIGDLQKKIRAAQRAHLQKMFPTIQGPKAFKRDRSLVSKIDKKATLAQVE